MLEETISCAAKISVAGINIDYSKRAIANRAKLNTFQTQDRALELREGGGKPLPISKELGIHTELVNRYVAAAAARRDVAKKLIPHPDPDSLNLTDPEKMLLLSVLEVRIINWQEGNCSDPDTGWVGRRVRRSSSWAVSCARRRLAASYHEPNQLGVFRVSGNGYIGLTDLGWSLATALHPEIVSEIITWTES